MLKNLRQDIRIVDAQLEASAAARAADKAQGRIERVDERFARLAMITEALWELLKSKTGWTDDLLAAEVAKLDHRDGVMDGRRTPRAVPCHVCQRNLPGEGRPCIYCGTPPAVSTPFSGLW